MGGRTQGSGSSKWAVTLNDTGILLRRAHMRAWHRNVLLLEQ